MCLYMEKMFYICRCSYAKNEKRINIMEAIRTVNDELRSQKSTSLLIGYVVVLAAMFAAFEYTQRDVVVQEEG